MVVSKEIQKLFDNSPKAASSILLPQEDIEIAEVAHKFSIKELEEQLVDTSSIDPYSEEYVCADRDNMIISAAMNLKKVKEAEFPPMTGVPKNFMRCYLSDSKKYVYLIRYEGQKTWENTLFPFKADHDQSLIIEQMYTDTQRFVLGDYMIFTKRLKFISIKSDRGFEGITPRNVFKMVQESKYHQLILKRGNYQEYAHLTDNNLYRLSINYAVNKSWETYTKIKEALPGFENYAFQTSTKHK